MKRDLMRRLDRLAPPRPVHDHSALKKALMVLTYEEREELRQLLRRSIDEGWGNIREWPSEPRQRAKKIFAVAAHR